MLPPPFRMGDQSAHGPEGLREAITFAGAGFGYLFLALFDARPEFILKGIELCAAGFTKVQEERLEQALHLRKGIVGTTLGPQDLPRTVTQAYALSLFQQGAGGYQLPGKPTQLPTVQLPVSMVPMGPYGYPPPIPAPLVPTHMVAPAPVIPQFGERPWDSPSAPIPGAMQLSPRPPDAIAASQPVSAPKRLPSPTPQRGRSASQSESRPTKPSLSPHTTRSRGRGRGRPF